MLTFLVFDFKRKPCCEAIQEVREVYGNYEVNKDSLSVCRCRSLFFPHVAGLWYWGANAIKAAAFFYKVDNIFYDLV